MERAGRVAVVSLAALVALVATATGNLTMLGIGDGALLYDTIALPRLAVSLVGVALVALAWALGIERGGGRLRIDPVWAILILLAAWGVVSTLSSPHRALAVLGQSERLEGLVTLVVYALTYGVTLQVVRKAHDARRVLGALGGVAVALSAYGLVQYAGLDWADYSLELYAFDLRRAFATFGNPNFFAGLLVLALPVVAAFALGGSSARSRAVWAVGALAVGAALFATFTRSAWLAVAVQAALAVWLWRRRGGTAPGGGARLALGATIVLVAVLMAVSLASTGERNVLTRLAEGIGGTGSASERSMLVGISAAAIAERPLLGHGPDAFLPAFRLHRSDAYVAAFGADATMNNAHSWPLQYAVTLGVPGALLLVAAVVASLWRSRRLLGGEAADRGGAPDVVLVGAWLGCLGFAVQMLFNVGALGSSLPFVVALGILGAPGARVVGLPRPAGPTLAAFSALALLVATAASAALVTADATYLVSRDRYHAGAFAEAAERAERAARLNPLSVKYARGAAQASAQVVQSAIISGASEAEVRSQYLTAAERFDRVVSAHPADYPVRAWYASLAARTGTHLADDGLVAEAVTLARSAAALDRQYVDVKDLADGDLSPVAIGMPALVPGLP